MPLGQSLKFSQKLAANVGPEIVVARADNIGRRRDARIRADVPEYAVLRSRAAVDCGTDPNGSCRLQAMADCRSETGSSSSRSHSPLGGHSKNLRRTLSKRGE